MATLRELKGRIGSVASSEKITGAMKMISSAKMHKAEQALKRLLPYREQVQTIIASLLSSDATFSSPLLESRPVQQVSIVVFGSDDGLCGAYNLNIFKQLLQRLNHYRDSYGETVAVTVYPVGSKIAKAVNRYAALTSGITVKSVEGVDSKTTAEGIRVFIDDLCREFTSGATDLVDMLYMNFQSVSRQRPVAEQILPLTPESLSGQAKITTRPFLFEPDPQSIFTAVLPMYLTSLMQEVFTENRASEQAARVMAMQSANDNAKKLQEQLTLEFNKLRQQSITTELLDILGGQVR